MIKLSSRFRHTGYIVLLLAWAGHPLAGRAQQADSAQILKNTFAQISGRTLHAIGDGYGNMQTGIVRDEQQILRRMEKKEEDLLKRTGRNDTGQTGQLVAGIRERYRQFYAQTQAPLDPAAALSARTYIPRMDSLQTAMRFLGQGGGIPEVPAGKLQEVQAISQQLQQVQDRWQQANAVQDFVRQREQQIRTELAASGLRKELASMNREVFNYQQQLTQWKEVLNNKEKREEVFMGVIRQVPSFSRFMQQNSLAARLFPMPANYGQPQALAGLQTKAQIQEILTQKKASVSAGSAGAGGGADAIQGQIQQAQSYLTELKSKLGKLGSNSGSGEMTLPDFTPDQQKTKTFLKRLEYVWTMQSIPATNISPVIEEMVFSVGYRLNDKITPGIGVNYNLGLGNGISHIQPSNQGAGLISFVDIRAHGTWWITGKYAYNYIAAISRLSEGSLPAGMATVPSPWQKSALVGLTKKFSMGKKNGGNLQLMYDCLYGQEYPRTGPVRFSVGCSF